MMMNPKNGVHSVITVELDGTIGTLQYMDFFIVIVHRDTKMKSKSIRIYLLSVIIIINKHESFFGMKISASKG